MQIDVANKSKQQQESRVVERCKHIAGSASYNHNCKLKRNMRGSTWGGCITAMGVLIQVNTSNKRGIC